jgi:hypothetical protein
MNKRYFVLLALAACLTGCVPVDSLNPLSTDKDVAFDESLLGSWVGPDNGTDGVLEFIARDEEGRKSYLMVMTDKDKESNVDKKTVYRARLVKLNDHTFLDVIPETFDSRPSSYSLQVKYGKDGVTIEPSLLKLGEAAYMEFSSAGPAAGGKAGAHLRRAHWILKVAVKGKDLQLNWPDDDNFRKAVEKGAVKLPTVLLGEGTSKDVVITAGTDELRKFVAEHADDEKFFDSKTSELHRRE